MGLPASRFLDPSTLAGIGDLRLVARTVVEGFLSGQHFDPRPSVGVEFNQYRSYQPGDDLRRVDWRAYARSDRFYVREAEVEREVTVRFLLDASASMGHGKAYAKFDYARMLVASLAYLVDSQGDRLALAALGDGGLEELPSGKRSRSLLYLVQLLEGLVPSGAWPEWEGIASRVCNAREREMVILVSDLYEAGREIRAAVDTLQALGHDVLVLHLLDRDELAFEYAGDLVFEDLESGERLRGDAAALRNAYLERMRSELAAWRDRLRAAGAGYELLPTDEPLDRALRIFLLHRHGR